MMQIAFYKGPARGLKNRLGRWLVCIGTASKYSHCELVIDGTCYSASARDGGKAAGARLQPMLDLPALPPGFFWTDADDNDVEVTPEELADLYVAHQLALIKKGFEIHVRQRGMKAAIESMTMSQLQAFVPGWGA